MASIAACRVVLAVFTVSVASTASVASAETWKPTDSSDRAKAAQSLCDIEAMRQLKPHGRLTFPPAKGPFDLRPAGPGRYLLVSWMSTEKAGRVYYLCEMRTSGGSGYGWTIDRFIRCTDCK